MKPSNVYRTLTNVLPLASKQESENPSMSSIVGTMARGEIRRYIDKGASIENRTAFVVYDLGC
jgi:hypothetical protein